MQGAYQQLRTKSMVDAGLTIGRSQALLQMDVQRDLLAGQNGQDVDLISQKFLEDTPQARDELGVIFEMAVQGIMSEPDSIAPPEVKKQLIDNLTYAVSAGRIRADLNTNDMTVAQLEGLINELQNPEQKNIEFLREYFPSFDITTNEAFKDQDGQIIPDRAAAKKFVSELHQIKAGLYAGEAKKKKAKEYEANLIKVANGYSPNNPSNRVAVDEIIRRRLNLKTSIVPEIWLNHPTAFSEDQRHQAIVQMKASGMLPQSLHEAFRGVNSSMDRDQLANMYKIYTDLKFVPTQAGEEKDLTNEIPEEVLGSLITASHIYGDGGGYNPTLVEALKMAEDMTSAENQWDPNTWIRSFKLNKIPIDAEDQTLENVDAAVSEYLIDNLLDNNYRKEELNQAVTLFKVLYKQQSGLVQPDRASEVALELTEHQMMTRFVDTEYGDQKTTMAVEKFYGEPLPDNMQEALFNIGKKLGGNAIKFAENVMGASRGYWQMINPFISRQPQEFNRADFGAREMLATPIDIIFSDRIDELVNEEKINPAYMKKKGSIWEPKVHYKTIPLAQYGYPPKYQILMIDAHSGTGTIVDNNFDPAPKYKEMTDHTASLESLLQGPAKAEALEEIIKNGLWDPNQGFLTSEEETIDSLRELGLLFTPNGWQKIVDTAKDNFANPNKNKNILIWETRDRANKLAQGFEQ